jgi:hypothetical protein
MANIFASSADLLPKAAPETNRYNPVSTHLHRKAIFPCDAGLLGNSLLAQFGLVTIDPTSRPPRPRPRLVP